MIVVTKNHEFQYEIEKLCRLFLPFEKFTFTKEYCEDTRFAVTEVRPGNNKTILFVSLSIEGEYVQHFDELNNDHSDYKKETERILVVQLFLCFCELTGYVPEWGILTGVRPAKLYRSLCYELGEEAAVRYFKEKLLVSDKKIELLSLAEKGEEAIIAKSKPNDASLYISVPFCPSRCAYCSFVSHSIDKAEKLIPPYVDKLCEELIHTAELVNQCGLTLKTVYIGGGTPTTLSAEQLTKVMDTVRNHFNLNELAEYTVEAGRPDTITHEKLSAIHRGGATRISINPQTMNDEVLRAIGRRHTAAETVEAFGLARKMGFSNINMDLIAGLTGDTTQSFIKTVEQVLFLDPESVTVHTLSLKRASALHQGGLFPEVEAGREAALMVDTAKKMLAKKEILPYYMYRQSKTLGNLENVGYCKKGYEGFYNVYIMDETHTILACGAGGVTKLKEPNGKYIERIFNHKYPYEYIKRFSEVVSRKNRVGDFYGKYRIKD